MLVRREGMMWVRAGCRCLIVGLAGLGIAAGGGDVRLADAAKNADWDAVRALLDQGADVSAPQADGTTALHWAAYWDHGDGADLVIRGGARVNAVNDLGVTPLWAASENGSAAMVRRLLQAGANPNAALVSGETPLMTAARTGNADVVKQLLAKGADVNATERGRGQTALMWAVAQHHADVVDVLVAHGGDLRARTDVWTQVVKTTEEPSNAPYIIDIQQGGYTPLLFAARVGALASAKLLVAAGADVNETAPYGTSAMVVAAHSGHGDVAAFLLEKGADPNAAGAGYTALHAAILRKDEKLVSALVVHGADPNAPVLRSTPVRRDAGDFYLPPAFVGATPFWLAARFNAPRIMRLLVEHRADPLFVHHPAFWEGTLSTVSSKDRRWIAEGNTTALMAAVGMGGPRLLVFVNRLDRIAEKEGRRAPDPDETEALILETIKTAADVGVDVNVANANGNTALHVAAARGYDSIIELLVQHGATVEVANNEGQTPLDVARAGSRRLGWRYTVPRRSTVELLREAGASE